MKDLRNKLIKFEIDYLKNGKAEFDNFDEAMH